MKRIFWLCFLVVLIIPNAFADSAQQSVAKVYYSWCTAIGTAKGDAAKIVKFYAPNAVLLPTLSSKILFNRDHGLDAYFKKLTSYPQIQCKPQELMTQLFGNIAINSGLYTFSYVDHGKITTIPARFSFVYKEYGNQWLIINHHSSRLP